MGFVFQTYNLLPVLTAVENVELPLLVSGFSGKDARAKALGKLAEVELEDWQHHLPGELSGGQRQRVTLARALVNDPAIVWADEPTGNLDSENERLIMDLLIQLNKENNQTFSNDPKCIAHTSEISNLGQIRIYPKSSNKQKHLRRP